MSPCSTGWANNCINSTAACVVATVQVHVLGVRLEQAEDVLLPLERGCVQHAQPQLLDRVEPVADLVPELHEDVHEVGGLHPLFDRRPEEVHLLHDHEDRHPLHVQQTGVSAQVFHELGRDLDLVDNQQVEDHEDVQGLEGDLDGSHPEVVGGVEEWHVVADGTPSGEEAVHGREVVQLFQPLQQADDSLGVLELGLDAFLHEVLVEARTQDLALLVVLVQDALHHVPIEDVPVDRLLHDQNLEELLLVRACGVLVRVGCVLLRKFFGFVRLLLCSPEQFDNDSVVSARDLLLQHPVLARHRLDRPFDDREDHGASEFVPEVDSLLLVLE